MQHSITKINGANPVGEFKRFGAIGPVYQVLEAIRHDGEDDDALKVSVLDSGETLTYPYSKFLADPRA